MEQSIYGKYGAYLPGVTKIIVDRIQQFNEECVQRTGENVYEHFLYRIKTEQSMLEKCARQGLEPNPESALYVIRDAIGLRIVCKFIDDIYEIVEYIRRIDGLSIVTEKDYIRNVKPNGYRSYHLIVEAEVPYEDVRGNKPGKYFAEIQLRTISMDSWAALEHQVKYKKDLGGVDLDLVTKELKRCADELASCDLSMQAIRNLVRSGGDGK